MLEKGQVSGVEYAIVALLVVSIVISSLAFYSSQRVSVPQDLAKKEDIGRLEDRISDLEQGQTDILEQMGVEKARISVTSIRVPKVTSNQKPKILAVLKNSGGKQGTKTISLTVEGKEVDSREVTLGPGETKDITFEIESKEKGEYTVRVGEVIGTLIVEEAKPLKIGVVTPITGPAASYGALVKKGAKLAAEEINAEGGVPGVGPIELSFYDTGTSPSTGKNASRKALYQDKISVGSGVISSSVGLAIRPLFEEVEVPLFTATSTTHKLTTKDTRFIFRGWPSTVRTGLFIVPFMKEELGIDNLALVLPDYAFGHSMGKILSTKAEEVGIDIIFKRFVPIGETEYVTVINEMKPLNPDAVFYPVGATGSTGLVPFWEQSRMQNFKPEYFLHYGGAPEYPHMNKLLKEPTLDFITTQVKTVVKVGMDPTDLKTIEFGEKYVERYGEIPALYSATVYDTINIAANAAAAAESTDSVKIRDTIRDMEYEGTAGPIVWGPFTEFGANKNARIRLGFIAKGGPPWAEQTKYHVKIKWEEPLPSPMTMEEAEKIMG